MIAEPDVALTDWLLAIEATVLAATMPRGPDLAHRAWRLFFASIAVAALLGGVAHGFLPDGRGVVAVVVWRATLLAIGLTAAAGLVAAVVAIAGRRRTIVVLAVLAWVGYAFVVVLVTDGFAVAIVAYAPVTLVLLGVFVARFLATRARSALLGALGLIVLLAGSWLQWRRVALHPIYFTHNALYHVIEMGALVLIQAGARGLVAPRR